MNGSESPAAIRPPRSAARRNFLTPPVMRNFFVYLSGARNTRTIQLWKPRAPLDRPPRHRRVEITAAQFLKEEVRGIWEPCHGYLNSSMPRRMS